MSIAERYRQIESVTKYSNYYIGRCYSWLSIPIAERSARFGLHPNTISLFSLLIALVAGYFFWQGGRTDVIIGAVVLYLSYVFDWSDGQLARFTGKMSPFGGWLDQMCDRTKEFVYVTTLAAGYYHRTGDVSIFVWALFALFFLFLLEYYGTMNRAIPAGKSTAETAAAAVAEPAYGKPTGNRRKVVIDFSIDEQYFFLVIALILVGAKLAIIGLVFLSALFAVYKPVKGWKRYFSEIK